VAVPRVFRERAKAQQRLRESMTSGVVWSIAAGGLALLATVAIVTRDNVARAWPKTASAYAAIGLPVNLAGVVVEGQQAAMGFEDGRPALRVSGAIRNVRRETVSAPPLRLILLDGEDQPLATRISRLSNPSIPAGEKREFVVTMYDPPNTVQDVEIRFELAGGEGGAEHEGGLRQRAPVSEGHGEGAHPAQGGEEDHAGEAYEPALRPAAH
jgi:hypothetical protein